MVDAVLRHRWELQAWLGACVYNAQPGRRQAVRAHRLNPYRGLWPEPEEDLDLDSFFGISDEE